MKFRKKPVVIEAEKYTNTNDREIMDWARLNGVRIFHSDSDPRNLFVETLEGNMIAQPGDWIIRGIKGEFYPCKPEIFEATYEKVEGA